MLLEDNLWRRAITIALLLLLFSPSSSSFDRLKKGKWTGGHDREEGGEGRGRWAIPCILNISLVNLKVDSQIIVISITLSGSGNKYGRKGADRQNRLSKLFIEQIIFEGGKIIPSHRLASPFLFPFCWLWWRKYYVYSMIRVRVKVLGNIKKLNNNVLS